MTSDRIYAKDRHRETKSDISKVCFYEDKAGQTDSLTMSEMTTDVEVWTWGGAGLGEWLQPRQTGSKYNFQPNTSEVINPSLF